VLKIGSVEFNPKTLAFVQRGGQRVSLRPQSLRVLEALAQADSAVMSKVVLMETVWKDIAVTDDSLVQCIGEIRQAIGDHDRTVLETVHRRGYRLNITRAGETLEAANYPVADQGELGLIASPALILPLEHGAIPSALAVMALRSMQGDELSERSAKAFAGDLLSKLSLNRDVPLISRHASFALQVQSLSASQISAQLKARYVVTGVVQISGASTHWALEMLDGETNQVLWSENKRAHFSNIPLETEALIWRLAGTIKNRYSASVINRLAAADVAQTPFEKVTRVYEVMLRSTPESAAESQQLSASLVAENPQYSPAWRCHANGHIWDMIFCFTGLWNDHRASEVLAELHKAIELDRKHGYLYSLLAHALCDNGQFDEAQIALQTALSLSPSDVGVLHFQAMVQFWLGQLNQALSTAEYALGVAPARSAVYLASRGRALVFLNRAAEGIVDLKESVVLSPGHNWARMALIVALEEAGEHAKAAEHYAELLKYTRRFDRAFFGRRWSKIPDIRDRYLKALGAHGFN
jgi:adenylate cyclase